MTPLLLFFFLLAEPFTPKEPVFDLGLNNVIPTYEFVRFGASKDVIDLRLSGVDSLLSINRDNKVIMSINKDGTTTFGVPPCEAAVEFAECLKILIEQWGPKP